MLKNDLLHLSNRPNIIAIIYMYIIHFKHFLNGAPGEIRTPDLVLRRHLRYPAEPLAHIKNLSVNYLIN